MQLLEKKCLELRRVPATQVVLSEVIDSVGGIIRPCRGRGKEV